MSKNTEYKVNRHKEICIDMNDTYEKKNHDYGDSFSKLRKEFPDAILIRLSDKLERLKSLKKSGKILVNESIRDTLLDMANYCIMEVIEIECENDEQKARQKDGKDLYSNTKV